MNKNRIRVVVLSAALALMLYALLGFLVLPYGAKRYLVAFFQDELGHRLALDEVRFNPFTFKAELAGIDLREPDGGPMFASRSALIEASVPDDVMRTISTEGTRLTISAAISTSPGVGAPKLVPSAVASVTALTIAGCACPWISGPHEQT